MTDKNAKIPLINLSLCFHLPVILSAAKNLMFYLPPRLPRGVYPENTFFDRLRMSVKKSLTKTIEGLAMTAL